MSIIDTTRKNAARVDFTAEEIVTVSGASRGATLATPVAFARESTRSRFTRFLAALGHNSTMGKNGFLMQDRAVFEEFRVSAQRQAMNK